MESIKKTTITLYFLSVVLLVSLTACSFPFNFFGITGSGNVISKDVDVSGFKKISLSGQGNLNIEQGNIEALEIEAEDNIMDLIIVDVKGDVLDIRYKKKSFRPTKDINFNINLKDLNSIKISGSGNVAADEIVTEDMNFSINGSGNVEMKLLAKTVKTKISGSGKFDLTGQSDSQDLTISGSGKYLTKEFKTKKTVIDINGSGKAEVNTRDELDIDIAGSGRVDYIGRPSINQNISGSGKINQLEGSTLEDSDKKEVEEEPEAEGAELSFEEAYTIAKRSVECWETGDITNKYIYNESTNTWWIELERSAEDSQDGCNPACVVDEKTKTAEVNYRCTGFIEDKESSIKETGEKNLHDPGITILE